MLAPNTAAFAFLTRSLREDNRLKQTYFARGGLICFILIMLLSSQNTYGYMGAPGLSFFYKVVLTNFFFITLTGLSYFAGAIAEEKEEGTLGLLRMTNLSPATILLGKSSSRLLGIALLLFVQLPFTLLAVTLGGVSIHQVFAAYVSLGAYIFLVCNLALLFSVVFERVGVASVVTGLALGGFLFAPVLGQGILFELVSHYHFLARNNPLVLGITWIMQKTARASVFGQLEAILTNGFAGRLLGFQVLSNLGLGLFFFGLAWWGFDRFTRERRPGALALKLPAWRISRFGMPGSGRAWKRAVWWKDFFVFHGGWNALLLKVAGFAGLVYLIEHGVRRATRNGSVADHGLQLGTGMVETFMLIFGAEMAFGAGRIFRAEIQGKTLAGLVGLPSTVARIAYQKVAALLLSCVPALGFAAVGWLLVLANGSNTLTDDLFSEDGMMSILIIGTQGLLFLHLTAYFSLSLKRLSLAVAIAVMIIGNMLVTAVAEIFIRSGPMKGMIILYHCGLLGLTAFLHVRIGRRLMQVAAAEG